MSDFVWPDPGNEVDERLISNVKVYGCHVLKVFGDEGPQFAYSVGLFLNYGHPEIIIVGLDNDLSHQFINDISERCARGETFLGGQRTDQLLKGYDACFVEVELTKYRTILIHDGGAIRLLRRRGVLVDTGAERYYLDEAAYERWRNRRRIILAVMLGVVALAAIVLMITNP